MNLPFLPFIAYRYAKELFSSLSNLAKKSNLTINSMEKIKLSYNGDFHKLPCSTECVPFSDDCDEAKNFDPATMIGVLVCKNKKGKFEILKAFSGEFMGSWHIDNWCDPCFDLEAYTDIVKKSDLVIKELTNQIEKLSGSNFDEEQKSLLVELIQKRKKYSRKVMRELFSLYRFNAVNGKSYSIMDLQKERFVSEKIPTGFGDCCGIKLLNEAFKNGLKPISMVEFYFGKESRDGKKFHGHFYGPCEQRCRLLMPAMLGLDILYLDEDIVVVNKPSGLLSVYGIGEDKQDCVSSRIKALYENVIDNPAVHRLDMDTCGVMVYALNKEAHRQLSIQFQNRETKKAYIAKVDGIPFLKDKNRLAQKGESGTINLPMRLDVENRPYQIIDHLHGKEAITYYEVMAIRGGKTKLKLVPHTGRTHQLRLHCASPEGLNTPIISDRLYGKKLEKVNLMLQAYSLTFFHPTKTKFDGSRLEMKFEVEQLF